MTIIDDQADFFQYVQNSPKSSRVKQADPIKMFNYDVIAGCGLTEYYTTAEKYGNVIWYLYINFGTHFKYVDMPLMHICIFYQDPPIWISVSVNFDMLSKILDLSLVYDFIYIYRFYSQPYKMKDQPYRCICILTYIAETEHQCTNV